MVNNTVALRQRTVAAATLRTRKNYERCGDESGIAIAIQLQDTHAKADAPRRRMLMKLTFAF